jgi:membrane protein DedA with SNARE-associated domain
MDLAAFSSSLIRLIQVHGPWIISVVVALESAGVPLPGETILVAAALLAAATNQIDIAVVVAAAAAGAIVGDVPRPAAARSPAFFAGRSRTSVAGYSAVSPGDVW